MSLESELSRRWGGERTFMVAIDMIMGASLTFARKHSDDLYDEIIAKSGREETKHERKLFEDTVKFVASVYNTDLVNDPTISMLNTVGRMMGL